MNIETQIYKAKSEKLMEQIKVLENSLQEALTQDNQYKSAFLTGERREEQIKKAEENEKLYSTGISGMIPQAGGAHSLEALGAGAVGGYIGASSVGTPVGIPLTKVGLGADVKTHISPGGFSPQKFSDAIGVGKDLEDAAFEGIESAKKVKVRSTNPRSGWGTKISEKLVGEVEKTKQVSKIAADMPAQIEKALIPHYPLAPSAAQRAYDAAERAQIAADATKKYTKAASASTPKVAQAIAKSSTASKALKVGTFFGKSALGKILTPVGAGLSAYEAYKEFSKGNYGRGAANVGLAAMNLVPLLNLLAIPGEAAMAVTAESVEMKGSEVNKKLYNFIN
jgi:hypothetical protein